MRELKLVEGDPAHGESMGALEPKRWEELGRILLDLGVIRKAVPISEVVSFQFTPTVLKHDPALPPPVWTDAPIPGH
jgi:hypothetical protein